MQARQSNTRVVITIWSDEVSSTARRRIANDLSTTISATRRGLKRVAPRHKTVAELTFRLRNPDDHACGIFSGFEIVLGGDTDARALKKLAMEIEQRGKRKEMVDIDVYVLHLHTGELVKFCRNGKTLALKDRMPLCELRQYH